MPAYKDSRPKKKDGRQKNKGNPALTKGVVLNPKGRPKGSLNKNTLLARAMMSDRGVEVVQKVIETVRQKYEVKIGTPVKYIFLGYFDNKEEARARYLEARDRAMQLCLGDLVIRTKNSIESFIKTGNF